MEERGGQLDAEAIIAEMSEGGAVAARIPHYESREEQLELTRLVIRGFNEDAILAAEAGTGVGKSFAYLLPAIRCALARKERVVVSTATINLQQQLFDKDIPFLTRAAGLSVKAALLKGRGNFLCLRRLRDEEADQTSGDLLPSAEEEAFRALRAWAETTKTGEKSDAAFTLPEALWAQVASDADSCLGSRCAFREACFFMASRREAEKAQLVVVNHHLLFADIAARYDGAGYTGTVVLPAYRRVILDEAHRIEDAATSFFSARFTRAGMTRQIHRLFRRKAAQRSGLLVRLRALLPPQKNASFDAEDRLTSRALEALEELDSAGLLLCGGESAFRLIPQRDAVIRTRLIPPLENLRAALSALCARTEGALAPLLSKKGEEEEDEEGARAEEIFAEEAPESGGLLRELQAALRALRAACKLCADFCAYSTQRERVFWIERRAGRRKGGDWAAWTAAPLDVGPLLKNALFKPNKTVICLSATLTVAGDFGYWQRRAGLSLSPSAAEKGRNKGASASRAPVLSGVFPSPFPYRTSVLLAVPADAPAPGTPGAAYQNFVNDAVFRLCRASGGGALVLFTAYGSLNSACAACAAPLEALGIPVLRQGDDDRARLLSRFLTSEESVLFATDSFWEGIDAPGDTLRLVIICRLPFISPNDPVLEARCEALQNAGGDPFSELSVPEAVMKFRQGFGRLIRRAGDRGVVAVLDSRLVRKSYGQIFLASLPETRVCFDTFAAVERAATLFFEG